jgi:hypothetical protein
MHNDTDNNTIQRNGRVYHYDPDLDIFYAHTEEESPISRWSWVGVVMLLALGCLAAEYQDPGLVTLILSWLDSLF